MRSLILTGLMFFFGVNLLHGQFATSSSGLEVENYKDVRLIIEDLQQDAIDFGLTNNRIKSRVNVRLRQVGLRPLYEGDDILTEYLHLNFHFVGGAVNLTLKFNRQVYFYKGGDIYIAYAAVYSKSILGTHGQNPEYIITGLDQLLDQFLSDYLDAND